MGVLGQATNSHISGVLVLRGQDHNAVVEVSSDWESHEYKRLDIYGCEEDKEFFEGALAWDLSVDGMAWADGENGKWTISDRFYDHGVYLLLPFNS